MSTDDEEPSRRQRLHDSLMESLAKAIRDARGDDPDLSDGEIEALAEGLVEARGRAADAMMPTLAENRPAMLQDLRERREAQVTEIRDVWGEALNQLLEVVLVVDEIARGIHQDHERDMARDATYSALMSVLARAVQAGHEVFVLLLHGLPAGAWARARSLHELAAAAILLSEHGRGDHRLGERYLLHSAVRKVAWAEEHTEHAEALGREPFTPEELENLREERERLTERFGENFGALYGWAAPVVEKPNSVLSLCEAAGLEHRGPDYTAASQHVHPTPWGGELNIEAGARTTWGRLTGLADPADNALVALHQTATCAVRSAPPEPNESDLIALAALERIVSEAQDAFLAASEEADRRVAGQNGGAGRDATD